jgi:serine/threonine-protein kinase
MAQQPFERYQSAFELKADLVNFIRGGGQFPQAQFPRGAHIVREGEIGDAAYIIASGRCEVYRTSESGRTRTSLRTMGPGEVFGETAILSPGLRTASVVALDDVVLRVVTRDVLEREVDSMKPWMGSFIRTLATRFRQRESGQEEPPKEQDATTIARRAFLHLCTWGIPQDDGALEMPWSALAAELVAELGIVSEELATLLSTAGGFAVDLPGNKVRVEDPASLRARLKW